MAKHNKGSKSNSFKNNNASKNAGGQFSGKKSNSQNYSSGSVGAGSLSSSGASSTSGLSQSSGMSGYGVGEEGMMNKFKGKFGEIATVDNLKSNLPTILGVALGAVGAWALYKNRAKIQQFIADQDFSLPSFLKGSESEVASIGATGSRKAGKKINTVSTSTH